MTALTQANTAFVLALWIIANVFVAVIWDVGCVWFATTDECYVSTHLSRWAKEFPVGVLALGVFLGHILWQSNHRNH